MLSILLSALLPPLVIMAVALGLFEILPADLPQVLSHEPLEYEAPTSPNELRDALQSATLHGDASSVERLLARGAPPDSRSRRRGPTPLMTAASRGDEEIVRLLVGAGADPSSRDPRGDPVLSLALSAGHELIALLLLEAGAEPDVPSPIRSTAAGSVAGPTPLWHAASTGATAAANALLWRGAAPDGKPPNFCPLVAAARHGHAAIAAALIAAGADPNPRVPVEDHPVVWAVRTNHSRLLTLLLEAAGTDLPGTVDKAARDLAVLEGRETLRRLLGPITASPPAKEGAPPSARP